MIYVSDGLDLDKQKSKVSLTYFRFCDSVDLSLWKINGEILHYRNAVPLRYDFYKGTRRIKLLDSREIRTIRDVCIFEINGMEVFL